MPLDQQARALLDPLDDLGAPPMSGRTVEEARTSYAALSVIIGPPEEPVPTRDRALPGPNGEIPVRVYRPPSDSPLPVIVYFHGGGWVIGDIATHDAVCHRLAAGVPAVVVGVDYRLAPEHGTGYLLDSDTITWFLGNYLGGADPRHPDASPLFVGDLSGLPPALVITAEFDPLRDEGEAYAERLAEAGVDVTASRYDGMIHGFYGLDSVFTSARWATDETVSALQKALS